MHSSQPVTQYTIQALAWIFPLHRIQRTLIYTYTATNVPPFGSGVPESAFYILQIIDLQIT